MLALLHAPAEFCGGNWHVFTNDTHTDIVEEYETQCAGGEGSSLRLRMLCTCWAAHVNAEALARFSQYEVRTIKLKDETTSCPGCVHPMSLQVN